jgi:hypothetical protein
MASFRASLLAPRRCASVFASLRVAAKPTTLAHARRRNVTGRVVIRYASRALPRDGWQPSMRASTADRAAFGHSKV